MLKIQDLHIAFGKQPILQGVQLDFEKGKLYGIIGPNGAGKSTLLSAMAKLIDVKKRSVLLEQKDISGYTPKELAQRISMMCQGFDVKFPYTIWQIVSMGRYAFSDGFLNSDDQGIIEKSMEDADVLSMKERKITELSGGEKQRVQFAKTLCQDTPVLLIDEGFSSMDIYYQVQFIKLLKQKAKQENKIVVFVMHDLSMARKHCDELVILKNGKVHGFGKSKEVLNEKTLYEVFGVKGRFIGNSLELE